MKMIIDIDERAYAECVKLKNNDDMGILGFHLINATANGTPLEEISNPCKECSQNCCVCELNGEKCECQKVYVVKENKE